VRSPAGLEIAIAIERDHEPGRLTMNHTTLTLAAAVVAAGLIGFGSPLAANAMSGMHHHHFMHLRHHQHYSCEYRHRYHHMYGYRHNCPPYHHKGYGSMGY
jgi:hypothetical protein